ncbi:hypothetical protein [Pseudofrankia sp. BMG5.37]|uniref:hypothetical protein n=1 Tax=Pseudofrankia sp. BMG5.37 TaxID=3050035 RepID=UPI002895CA37|nr:hypothetical protein [Pseudofrankia sp. BMG5.37]MDT3440469.1 hypothetical protein [Pseudofrankia sp. BMG5.37]
MSMVRPPRLRVDDRGVAVPELAEDVAAHASIVAGSGRMGDRTPARVPIGPAAVRRRRRPSGAHPPPPARSDPRRRSRRRGGQRDSERRRNGPRRDEQRRGRRPRTPRRRRMGPVAGFLLGLAVAGTLAAPLWLARLV